MRKNRSEYHTNQALKGSRNIWLINPYNQKVTKKVTKSSFYLIMWLIMAIMFAEPVINNVFSYFGV